MSATSKIPFNVSLLDLTPDKLKALKPVTALDIFEGGATTNFHEDGLFSVSTFGPIGSDLRDKKFSFIDLKVEIFHPIIYKCLVDLKRFYAGVMAGKEYAIWNSEIKDFERSNALEGETGFQFFVKHWKDIEFESTKSDSREQSITLIKKYKNAAMTSKVVVMPAGYRDVEFEGGRVHEDEINVFYRKMLSVSNTITPAVVKAHPEMINAARHSLQMEFNKLYDFIVKLVEGKKKLLLGKWASRRIFDGTRNVITAMNASVPMLGAPGAVGINNTIIGLFQALKAIRPVATYLIRNTYASKVFVGVDAPARLVNKKTLKMEEVRLKSVWYDRWMTDEGIEKVISAFADENLRHKPVDVDGYYFGLIYKGPDATFKFMQSIDELPKGRNPADVHPITFAELLYLSVYKKINNYPLLVTRYPVTGVGSIYPSFVYCKTTVSSECRYELADDWSPIEDGVAAHQFPIKGAEFVNSLVPHPSKILRLGADFDGDTASGNISYTEESIEETQNFLNSKRAYIGTDSKLISSVAVDTVNLLFYNLTGD